MCIRDRKYALENRKELILTDPEATRFFITWEQAIDVIFSGRDYNEIIAALDSLAGRFFTYEDDEEWWKCGFISLSLIHI